MKSRVFPILALLSLWEAHAQALPLEIVAAENFYGGVAKEVCGDKAKVTSILTNPNEDPHEFTSSAGTAKSIADADIVIYSGIDYDPWVSKLLETRGKSDRTVINVSQLIGAKEGDNPHIWYNSQTMPALADRLAEVLSKRYPKQASAFAQQANSFKSLMKKELAEIAQIKALAGAATVTATEPVFGYMADALGLKMINYGFQMAIMNDSEPSADETAEFEKSLRSHQAVILFYNSQVTDPTTARMQQIAQDCDVPIVGVSETQPPEEKSYVDWMIDQLDRVKVSLLKKNG